MTREKLEAEPNWQATYWNPIAKKHFCLMRMLFVGRYYWHEAEYDGLFSWGATLGFNFPSLQFMQEHGYAELVAGTKPQELPPTVVDCQR